jgi:hypothetical protein
MLKTLNENHNRWILNLITHGRIVAGGQEKIYGTDWGKHNGPLPKILKDVDDDCVYLTTACYNIED